MKLSKVPVNVVLKRIFIFRSGFLRTLTSAQNDGDGSGFSHTLTQNDRTHIMMRIIYLMLCSISLHLCAAEQQEVQKNPLEILQEHQISTHSLYSHMNYVGVAQPGAEQFSLSRIIIQAQTPTNFIEGMAPKTVVLNHTPDQPNPLYNAAVTSLFKGRGGNPCVVIKDQPDCLYLLDSLTSTTYQSLLMTDTIADAAGQSIAGTVQCATGNTSSDDRYFAQYTLAAVKAHEGNFGDPNSGFALIHHWVKTITQEKKHAPDYTEVKHEYENYMQLLDATTGASGNLALPWHHARSACDIKGGLDTIMPNIISLCWHPQTERFYLAVCPSTKHDASSEQGVCALAIGRIYQQRLYIDPFVPSHACMHDLSFCAMGPDQHIYIHNMLPWRTSTGCPYLIIVGGHGTADTTNRHVWVFPLVHKGQEKNRTEIMQDPEHGSLAACNSSAAIVYHRLSKSHETVQSRLFRTPAQTVRDIPSMYDAATKVGGDSDLPGPISDITVINDAIIVSVNKSTSTAPGVFHSQPIFDGQGTVVAWTPWQRLFGSAQAIFAFHVAQNYALTYMLEDPLHCFTQPWFKDTKTRHRTHEQTTPLGFTALYLEQPDLYMVHDIPLNTPGMQHISAMLCAGPDYCALIETSAHVQNGILVHPDTIREDEIIRCTNDGLTELSPAQHPRVLTMTGPIISWLGAIQSGAIVSDESYAWLVVAGTHGLALLAAPDGTGWSVHEGLSNGFVGLPPHFTFKKCGNFHQVKKVVQENNALYILTTTALYRLPISPVTLQDPDTYGECLCTAQTFSCVFFDLVLHGGTAIIGTSQGLLYNTVDLDIADAHNINWSRFMLPGFSPCTYKLYGIYPQQKQCGVQLYALTGAPQDNKTDIYRLYSAPGEAPVLITDTAINKNPGPWCSCNFFITDCAYDGLQLFAASSGFKHTKTALYLITFDHISRIFVKYQACYDIPLGIHKKDVVTAVTQNSATGNWLVAGSFGLRSNVLT